MIRLPRKPVEILMMLFLSVVSFFLAIFGKTVSNFEGRLLILASFVHIYFFIQVARDRVVLYGWSLISIIWAIPGFFSLWIIIRELS